MKKLLIVCMILSLSGCAVFSKQIDQAAKAAGKAVTFYCENVTSQEIRESFRAKVNAVATPNSVTVTCASGGPVMKSAQ